MNELRVAILGSCVSRDLFEFNIDNISNFKVVNYNSRATILSIMNNFNPDIMNNFNEKKCLEDVNKKHFFMLENSNYDILIIDLIDERHRTYIYNNNYLTYTNISRQFIDPLLKQGKGKLIEPFSSEMDDYLNVFIPVFMEKIIEISKEKFVFLHSARYSLEYLDSNGALQMFDEDTRKKINNWNLFLSKIYNRFDNKIIRLGGDNIKCYAGGTHKWDLQPFHYDISYYEELVKDLISHIE